MVIVRAGMSNDGPQSRSRSISAETFTDPIVLHDQRRPGRVFQSQGADDGRHDPTEGHDPGHPHPCLARRRPSPVSACSRVIHATTMFTNCADRAAARWRGDRPELPPRVFATLWRCGASFKYDLYDHVSSNSGCADSRPAARCASRWARRRCAPGGGRRTCRSTMNEVLDAGRAPRPAGRRKSVAVVFLPLPTRNPAHEPPAARRTAGAPTSRKLHVLDLERGSRRRFARFEAHLHHGGETPISVRWPIVICAASAISWQYSGSAVRWLMMLSNGGFTHAEEACPLTRFSCSNPGPARGAAIAGPPSFSKRSGIAERAGPSTWAGTNREAQRSSKTPTSR